MPTAPFDAISIRAKLTDLINRATQADAVITAGISQITNGATLAGGLLAELNDQSLQASIKAYADADPSDDVPGKITKAISALLTRKRKTTAGLAVLAAWQATATDLSADNVAAVKAALNTAIDNSVK